MTGRKFVNGGDTKTCGHGEVLRCWGIAAGVLPRLANLLPGEKPYGPRICSELRPIYRSQLRTVCSK